MWARKNQTGYTIVETLIVLAVTGVIFISTSLMIRGQVAKYQYRESMIQLEQSIKIIVNSVGNGTFGSPDEFGSYNGTSDTLLIGRRFWFCADDATLLLMPFCYPPISPITPNGQIMHVETVARNTVGPAAPTYLTNSSKTLPSGLKFIGYKVLDSSGNVAAGPGSKEFGTSILFSMDNGDAIDSVSANNRGIKLYGRSAYTAANSLITLSGGNGYILCFEGNNRGSIQLGSTVLGTTIAMNLLDERCSW